MGTYCISEKPWGWGNMFYIGLYRENVKNRLV